MQSRSPNAFLPKKQKDRLNAPPAPFIWETQAMLESEAFRRLSVNAYRVIARLQVEHLAHGGLENGRLPVSFDDFVTYGIRRNAIRPAIEELVAAGFIRVEHQGRRNRGDVYGAPAEYRLTWLPVGTETDFQHATNEWKAAQPRAKKVFPP
jgi:hypothetical protein